MKVNTVMKKKLLSRDLFLNGNICEQTIGPIIEDIVELNNIDDMNEEILKSYERDAIILRINTYGGYADDKWALVDTIISSETPIFTVAMGKVMSAGISILAAGDKRFGHKHSSYMVHNVNGGAYGAPEDVKIRYDDMKKTEQQFKDFMAERTEFPKDKLEKIIKHKEDFYFGSEEALKFKLIDELI